MNEQLKQLAEECGGRLDDLYSTPCTFDQIKDELKAAFRQVVELCAREVEHLGCSPVTEGFRDGYYEAKNQGVAAIRALVEEK